MNQNETASEELKQSILLAAALLMENPDLLDSFQQEPLDTEDTNNQMMFVTEDEKSLLKYVRELDSITVDLVEATLRHYSKVIKREANSEDAEMTGKMKKELLTTSFSLVCLASAIKAIHVSLKIDSLRTQLTGEEVKTTNDNQN